MTIFSANKIYTLDEDDQVFKNLWVQNSKVTRLNNEQPLITNQSIVLLKDKYIIPGFIESHMHILGTGLQYLFPNFSNASSLEQIFDILLDAYMKNKEFKFMLGYNFEPGNIKEIRYPNRTELDHVIKDIPVLIYRVDGHSAALNTKGLELAFGNKVEEGIEIDAYKIQTGIVRGQAFEHAAKRFRKFLNPDIRIQALVIACEQAVKKGITTMVGMIGSDEPEDDSVELLFKIKDKLPIEVIPFFQTQKLDRVISMGLSRIGGCILIDGSFGSHTAALSKDYSDEPGNKGTLYFDDDRLLNFLKQASGVNLQIAVHAIGDRAINQVVRCYEKFMTENRLRHRIEHAELLNNDLIERIARLGLILSVQPAFEHFWGGKDKMYAERLGQRYIRTNSYRKLIDNRITLCGGSDSPITSLDPLLGIKSAVNHPNSEHRISIKEAMQMFTKNGAYAIFKENEIGMLKSGFSADFLILSADPFQTLDFQILEVYKAGKKIYP